MDLNGWTHSVLRKESTMLWTICVILVVRCVLGLVSGYAMGGGGPLGEKDLVAILTLAGEGGVFATEVVSRSRKILPNLLISSLDKVSQPTSSPQAERKEYPLMQRINTGMHYLGRLMPIATLASCASARTSESAGEYVDDSVITAKVKMLRKINLPRHSRSVSKRTRASFI